MINGEEILNKWKIKFHNHCRMKSILDLDDAN